MSARLLGVAGWSLGLGALFFGAGRRRLSPPGEGGRVLDLHQEELEATVRPRVAGHLRVHKYVVTEKRTLEVMVRREEIRVERVGATGGEGGRRASSRVEWVLPLYEDKIEIVRRPVVREWVRIFKQRRVEPTRFEATVRQEVATVETSPRVRREQSSPSPRS